MTYHVFIADDHVLFTEGLVKVINSFANFQVIDTASNGAELLTKLNNKATQTDIIILDICMPKLSGLEALEEIKNKYPHCKVLICTMYYTKSITAEVTKHTVQGVITKTFSTRQLEDVLNKIAIGETFFPEEFEQQSGYAKNILGSDDFYLLQQLTKREKEILTLIKHGHSSKKIASQLFLSETTINTHRSNICQKIKLKNPAEIIAFAHKVLPLS